MRKLALCLALLAVGCSDSVNVGNENPTGLVGGVVVDAADQMPLAGVMVQVVTAAGQQTAMSDMNGVFQVKNVPAGSLIITFTQMGYVTATFNTVLAGAVGNFPVHDPTLTLGPIGLVKNSGTFTVRIVDQGGAPVPMVNAIAHTEVRWVDFSSGGPQSQGSYSVTAMTGSDGLAAFSGLPDYASLGHTVNTGIQVDVPPMMVASDGGYQFFGITASFDAYANAGSTPTIVLAGPLTGLSVLESSIDALRSPGIFSAPVGSEIPPGGPITVVFNQAIEAGSVRADFLNDDGTASAIQAMAAAQSNLLTITPSTAFTAGARMNLELHAVAMHASNSPAYEYNATVPFWIQPQAGSTPATITSGALAPTVDPNQAAKTLVFNLSEPIGLGRGSNGAIGCVAFYEGANFDNADGAFPGNWTVNGQTGVPSALACNYPSGASAEINVTTIVPMETPVPGVGYTGFASRWAVRFDDPAGTGGCSSALGTTNCQRPASGTKIHLIFSKQAPGSTVRRVDGTPVDDSIVVVIP